MIRKRSHPWWVLLVLLLDAVGSAASTVVPLDVGQLTDGARSIFLGTCVAARADSLDGDIVTRFTFVVAEGLKGVAADTVRVVLPGGELDGLREHIAGMPSFVPGEEVVLFLTGDDGHGRVWPVGLGQGGFRVRRSTDGPTRVRRDLGGLRFIGGSARAAGRPAPDMALDDLLERVRQHLGDDARHSDAAGADAAGNRR